MLKLHFKDGRQAPLWLTEERLALGQDARNQLVLEGEGVSAFHAEIRQEQGHYYLTDCGSQTGTFVNDERIGSRYQLRAGDALRLGDVLLELSDPAKTTRAPVADAGRWFLQVTRGEHLGHKYPISASQTFGRSAECELCFAGDMELSRRHCEFFLKDEALHFKDLGSANGVAVNGEKRKAGALQPGDELRMGSVGLLVIGPKREAQSAESAQDEDATLFMAAVKLPKPAARPQASQAAAPNPLRASQAPAVEPAAAGASKGIWIVLAAVVVAAGVAAGLLLR